MHVTMQIALEGIQAVEQAYQSGAGIGRRSEAAWRCAHIFEQRAGGLVSGRNRLVNVGRAAGSRQHGYVDHDNDRQAEDHDAHSIGPVFR